MASKKGSFRKAPVKSNLVVYVILKGAFVTNHFKEKVEKVLLNAEAQQDTGCSILIQIGWN